MKNRTLLSVTDTALNIGIAKFNIMLLDAKTKKDMFKLLPYCNLVLQHLKGRKEKALGDTIFEDYWARYEEIRDAKS